MPLEKLGPYKIVRPLGHGGMGSVFEGVQEETGERAALKVLSEALAADARFRERFKSEVDTLKILRHENIVSLYGYGEEDGRLFFVMELVEGSSLDGELQAGRRFDWRQTAAIAIQVCAALKHAHDHGVIHRDLKPANLLMMPSGQVKLTDFGIAKLFGHTNLTLAGSMIGTPEFMSPEQTDGQPATPRSDLYSLGCVMFALVAGRPPFHGEVMTRLIDRVRKEMPPPLRRFVYDVPEEFDQIIQLLLRKNPAERIGSPQSLSRLLQAAVHALNKREEQPDRSDLTEIEVPGLSEATKIGGATQQSASASRDTAERPTSQIDTSERPTSELPVSDDRADHPGGATQSDSEFEVEDRTLASKIAGAKTELEPTDAASDAAESPATHFTTVAEEVARRKVDGADRAARKEWWIIAAMAVALIAIVAAFVYVFIPRSADGLYADIVRQRSESPPPHEYEADLEEFLERFPDDPRADEVKLWWEQNEVVTLRAVLEMKRTLTDWEKLFLKAMREIDAGQDDEALAALKQIRQEYLDLGGGFFDRRVYERTEFLISQLSGRVATSEQ